MSWIDLSVPGRLCLFGEHSDWAGEYRVHDRGIAPGHCITVGTDQGIRARARRAHGLISGRSILPDGTRPEPLSIPANNDRLRAVADAGGFWSYVAGTVLAVRDEYDVGGIDLDMWQMDLPIKKGLSSSAAVCVVVARSMNRLYELGLSQREEMELAYRGETSTPSRCGRMDQICAYGRVACSLLFDGDSLDVEPLRLGGSFHLLVVDLNGEKNTVRILRDLNAQFPDTPGPTAARVREALGPINRDITDAACATLRAGDARQLGELMRCAQNVFDQYIAPACPSELSAPLLHRVLAMPELADLTYGGKGIGSQGDGTAQLVTRGPAERERAHHVVESKLDMSCFDLTLGVSAPRTTDD